MKKALAIIGSILAGLVALFIGGTSKKRKELKNVDGRIAQSKKEVAEIKKDVAKVMKQRKKKEKDLKNVEKDFSDKYGSSVDDYLRYINGSK